MKMNLNKLIFFIVLLSISLPQASAAWTIPTDSAWANGTFINTSVFSTDNTLVLSQRVDSYLSWWPGDDGTGSTLTDENRTTANDGTMNSNNFTTSAMFGGAINCSGGDDMLGIM
jgi:hypothetical protein